MEKQALTYSIAIRTLGTAGDVFLEELASIVRQTVQPRRVLVYIAEGYERPAQTIGREEYVWVKKGMMAQRVLPYNEITSDCILMLDDDVRLAEDSAERLLQAMGEYDADVVGADTFKNQDMNVMGKCYAAITNFVFPHHSSMWAFKIHRNGSFSYNNNPTKPFYLSQSCAGPASMWRKPVFISLNFQEELWLDMLGFAHGDDALMFYKVYKNGYRLGILYESGIENLNGKSSSAVYRKSANKMYTRTFAGFTIWWRSCFKAGNSSIAEQGLTALCYAFKTSWLSIVVTTASFILLRPQLIIQFVKAHVDGWNYVHSSKFRSLQPYAFLKR